MKNNDKTNVMRLLDAAGIDYDYYFFGDGTAVSGDVVASILGKEPGSVFKTLVTIGKSRQNYVFMVPVNCELNLKKAANAVGEKNIEMIKSKELLPLTGYVHGGCSPIGMKKQFVTVMDESAILYDRILFSAGRIGAQIEMNPLDLSKMIDVTLSDIV